MTHFRLTVAAGSPVGAATAGAVVGNATAVSQESTRRGRRGGGTAGMPLTRR